MNQRHQAADAWARYAALITAQIEALEVAIDQTDRQPGAPDSLPDSIRFAP